ncbi:hypothetical protein T439DRAFT_328916 [Meredithblackwellia eburnea MCA 4105]
MGRQIPCTECRRVRVRCIWPEEGEDGDGETCKRCLRRPDLSCSGPTRKSLPPCSACVKGKTKCVWNEDATSCDKCLVRKNPCPGPMMIEPPCKKHKCQKSKQIPSEVISLKSEKLSQAATLNLFDIQLAYEGKGHLEELDFTCVQDAFAIKDNPANPQLLDITTLLFVTAGVKFSAHEVIIGDTARTLPPKVSLITAPDTSPDNFLLAGLRRASSLRTLSARVWAGFDFIDPDVPIPRDQILHYVSAVRLAAKVCELEDRDDKERVRRLLAWATEAAVRELSEGDLSEEEEELLSNSAMQLAVREQVESIALRVPSLIPPVVYFTACKLSGNPSLPKLSPSKFDVVFLPPIAFSRYDLTQFIWKDLLAPVTDYLFTHIRVLDLCRTDIKGSTNFWWKGIDALFDYSEDIHNLIISHDKNNPEHADRVWAVLRSVYTAEQCSIDMSMMHHRMVDEIVMNSKKGVEDPEIVEILDGSSRRVRSMLIRMAKRMKLIMSSPAATLPSLYYLLEQIVSNVSRIGCRFAACFQTLPREEQEWLLRALQFAAFWDASAATAVTELDHLMSGLSIDSPPDPYGPLPFKFTPPSPDSPPVDGLSDLKSLFQKAAKKSAEMSSFAAMEELSEQMVVDALAEMA